MKIKVEELIQLFDKYPDELKIQYFENISISGHNHLSTDIILKAHVDQMVQNRIEEVEVFYDAQMYDYLNSMFPVVYRKPYGQMGFMDIDRYLEQIEKVNYSSERNRCIINIGDIYTIDSKTGKASTLIHHDEQLNYKKWNILKTHIDRNHKFLYRYNECAIIIFIDLSENTDSTYIKKFKKNIDLISLMVSDHKNKERLIAPDFVSSNDVISVTDPEILLDEYKKNQARLIIIGERLNDSYKKALVKVRRYDKWVRMLVVPELDHNNIDHFFKQVKLVYNSDRWP